MANGEEDVHRIFEEELSRLGVSYIDFLLLHAMNAERWDMAKKWHANEYQQELKRQGKIRYAGFSFHDTPESLRRILSEGQWDFCQLQINYFDWDDYAHELYDIATEFGVPIIVMEPVRGGALANLALDRLTWPKTSPSLSGPHVRRPPTWNGPFVSSPPWIT